MGLNSIKLKPPFISSEIVPALGKVVGSQSSIWGMNFLMAASSKAKSAPLISSFFSPSYIPKSINKVVCAYNEDSEARLALEGSELEGGQNILRCTLLSAGVESNTLICVLNVEVHRSVVLLHDVAGTAPG